MLFTLSFTEVPDIKTICFVRFYVYKMQIAGSFFKEKFLK